MQDIEFKVMDTKRKAMAWTTNELTIDSKTLW